VLDEFTECEAAFRADPRWQEAHCAGAGDRLGLAMVDSWSPATSVFADDEAAGGSVRARPGPQASDDQYGLTRGRLQSCSTVVDLTAMQV